MNFSLLTICQIACVSFCLVGGRALAQESSEELFVRRIGPLLQQKCYACHGAKAESIEGGLDLSGSTSALRGGESGEPAIGAGGPETSPLYLAATRTHDDWSAMPPKEAERLSAEQLDWLRIWIATGAAWPDQHRAAEVGRENSARWDAEDGVSVRTSGGLAEEWTRRRYKPASLWAYQPVVKPSVPATREHDSGSTLHPIDAFIAARLPAELQLAPMAEPAALIRRASYDLTGLPPTPAQVADYVQRSDPSSAAYNELVDSLLDSPHYGERMAQHWLDVVRYADTSGFANDFERGNAWRYRDYVIRSFNADKPYDQFVREQLAGDEIDPEDPQLLVATGFLRMGPWELTGMEVAKVARQRFLDDVTNSVGETFLAQSLQCCRCHDHKFDPIPTRDYYSVQAVFATTQLVERAAPFAIGENLANFDEVKYLQARVAQYEQALRVLDEKLLTKATGWFDENQISPERWHAAVADALLKKDSKRDAQGIFNQARNLLAKQGVSEDLYPPKLYGFTPEDFGNERVARKGLQRLIWEMDRYQPFALAVYNGRTPQVDSVYAPQRIPSSRLSEGVLEETCILTGGDPFASGEGVSPGVLSVLGDVALPDFPEGIEGRRTAFATWVANQANPLTVRAIVNRVWLWHFGQPLAGNPNNFGGTGKPPTHPELLDWLSCKLVEEGWSLKQLHRVIMTSQAYRRSANHPDAAKLVELDPSHTSYAAFQPRRLSAEELRDSMLAATGELNFELGGIPNRPEINLEAALQPRQVMGTFAAAWVPNPLPSQRHRRSIYALKVRGLPDPHLEVFNQPTPDFSCERREVSNVTPQAFSLFNSQNSYARALTLANRALSERTSDRSAVVRCFELALGRSSTDSETQLSLQHWQAIENLIAADEPQRMQPPLEVQRLAVEENTGERFVFSETLHAYADFVPDLQAGDVNLHTRALADLCLTLFNSNEFAYVY